jgi:hypothetical protein
MNTTTVAPRKNSNANWAALGSHANNWPRNQGTSSPNNASPPAVPGSVEGQPS